MATSFKLEAREAAAHARMLRATLVVLVTAIILAPAFYVAAAFLHRWDLARVATAILAVAGASMAILRAYRAWLAFRLGRRGAAFVNATVLLVFAASAASLIYIVVWEWPPSA